MKYNDKFPKAKPLDEFYTNICCLIIKLKKEKPCDICGELTNWFEKDFQRFLCSEECCDKYWDKFCEETNK